LGQPTELIIDRAHSASLFDVTAVHALDGNKALVLSHREATVDLLDMESDSATRVARKGSGPFELRFPIAFAPHRGASLPRIVDLGRRALISLDSTLRDAPFPTSVDARTDIVPLLAHIPVTATSEGQRLQLFKPDSALFYPRSFRRALILAVEGQVITDTITRFAPIDSGTPVTATYLPDHPLACATGDAGLFVLDPVAQSIRSFTGSVEGPRFDVDQSLLRVQGATLGREEQLNFIRHLNRRALIGANMSAHDSTVERLVRESESDGSVQVFIGNTRPLAAAMVCDKAGGYVLLERFELSREGVGHSGTWVKVSLGQKAASTVLRAPRNIRVFAASGTTLWGVQRDEDDLERLVRMRIPE
jgi:hypothetical protein